MRLDRQITNDEKAGYQKDEVALAPGSERSNRGRSRVTLKQDISARDLLEGSLRDAPKDLKNTSVTRLMSDNSHKEAFHRSQAMHCMYQPRQVPA